MKLSLALWAAILLTPLKVTAQQAASAAPNTNPPTADTTVPPTQTKPVPGMATGGAGPHHRHGMKHGKEKHGHGASHGGKHQDFHRQLINRLDLMDARLTKMEAMLEKLLQR